MAENTAISWCDHTFNPWIGCTKVSPACDGCYAENLMANRYGRVAWGGPGKGAGTRVRTSEANWRLPKRWDRRAAIDGMKPFVFCASLADVFDNQISVVWRSDLFDLIQRTPNLVWLLLTKRPQLIVDLAEEAGGLPSNVALGTTAENQEIWNRNIGELVNAKAVLGALFAFASIEPMLGPIMPRKALVTSSMRHHFTWSSRAHHDPFDPLHPKQDPRFRLDWIITGGETDQGGHRARPSHPDWFRQVRDDCAATGTPYHHKQNGEWMLASEENGHTDHNMERNDAIWIDLKGRVSKPSSNGLDRPIAMFRSGKSRAGRLLDGVEHNERPRVS